MRITALVLGLFMLISCQETVSEPQVGLIDQIFLIAEANALNRYTIDWVKAKSEVENISSKQGLEQAIFAFLGILGDNHSVYISKDSKTIRNSEISCIPAEFEVTYSDELVGYVKVKAFSGSGVGDVEFAKALQEEIKRQDHEDMKGWIVDLSGNEGGNMYPMIAGIGPLLGNGDHGYFVTPDDIATPWGYNNGRAYLNSRFNALTDVVDHYEIMQPNPRIAIVMDNKTASAAEAVAISFLEKYGVRFFGQSSCGLSTANIGYPLINGGRLFITASVMADRNQKPFGSAIHPDVLVDDTFSLNQALKDFFTD